LFYLITDIYQNSGGTTKELRKWAYEIFSTFLIPNAPLSVPNIDQPIVQAIDKVLSCPANSEQDDQLKRLFIAARQVSVDDANDHLTDFRQKRQIGLGTVFDRNMLAGVVVGDRAKELKVADTLLMPGFERLFAGAADFESLETRSQALACALGTVIKLGLCLRPSCNVHEKLLDKCPTFVTKDKSGKFKIKSMASKRSVQVKGHQFLLNNVNVTVYCYHCREAVWGINAQAYFCTNCDVVLHKQCTSALTDSCYPAQTQKAKQQT
uniref:Phorbol-ester/DAG-type domain-containing protein n=1 Tax=Plectus sambesii TaxID=2011161 RepID=A0A914V3D3_9BILA